jgi:hypothetical protein
VDVYRGLKHFLENREHGYTVCALDQVHYAEQRIMPSRLAPDRQCV